MLKQWIVCVCVVTQDRLFVTPWTGAHQAPLSMALSRQKYWSGLLVSTPGDLPNPGIEPASPALAGRFFTTKSPGKPFPLLVNDSIFHSVNKLKVFIIFNSCTSQLRSYTDFLPPKSILN